MSEKYNVIFVIAVNLFKRRDLFFFFLFL